MATGDRGIALRQLNALFSIGVIGGVTDAQLLEWFTSHRDETADLAFRALVERHGPMVLRVCRAMLRDAADADDAFQATRSWSWCAGTVRFGCGTRWGRGSIRWPVARHLAPGRPRPGGGGTSCVRLK
jgi:hypothetical protein